MWRLVFSLILVASPCLLFAQPGDTTRVKEKKDFRPSILRVGYNLILPARSIFPGVNSGHEVQGAVDFANYFVVGSFGTLNTHRGEDYTYENSGRYFRVGLEANLLKNEKENSMVLGIRYARSNFGDRLYFADSTFFTRVLEAENEEVTARWWELTAGLNVRVWSQLYLGYTIRYKAFRKVEGFGPVEPYEIPGFGRYENESTAGFDFYISWVIRYRQKEETIVPAK